MRQRARAPDTVLSLAAQQSIKIGLFRFHLDREVRAGEAYVRIAAPLAVRARSSGSKTKLGIVDRCAIEIDRHPPGCPPGHRPLGRRGRRRSTSRSRKGPDPSGRVQDWPARRRSRALASSGRRPPTLGPAFPSDRTFPTQGERLPCRARARELARNVKGASNRCRVCIELNVVDFPRDAVGAGNDPDPSVLHDKAIEAGRVGPRQGKCGKTRRSIYASRHRQDRLLELNFREADAPLSSSHQRKLQSRRLEGQPGAALRLFPKLNPLPPPGTELARAGARSVRLERCRRRSWRPAANLISERWADQSTRSGATSAVERIATSATATIVRTMRTEKRFSLRLD